MKRFTSILMFSVIVFCTMGTFVVFQILNNKVRSEIKTQIKNRVSDEELEIIIFDKNDSPNWTRVGKEFRLNNRLYDIVKKAKTNGRIVYSCINDIQEVALFSSLDKMVFEHHNDSKNHSGHILMNLMKIHFVSNDTSTFQIATINMNNIVVLKPYCYSLGSTLSGPDSPPPNFI